MKILPYTAGNEAEVLKLFALAFGKQMSAEYWNWRFLNNPFTPDLQIHLMWENEMLVGHYAVSPINFLVDGESAMCALSMTTMTHPDFGGKGIFTALAESLYSQLTENGYDFVWGFPNSNSHYGFVKNLAWTDIGIVPMLTLDIGKFKTLPQVTYQLLKNFNDLDITHLQDESPIAINKTVAYFNWRYVINPSAGYKILKTNSGNIVVYKKIVSFINSAEFEIDLLEFSKIKTPLDLSELLSAIIIEEGQAMKFNTWHSLHQSTYLTFEKLGFKQTMPNTYLGYRSFNANKKNLSDFRNWNVSMGYSDVF